MTRYAPTRSLVNSTPDFPNGLTVSLGNVGIGTTGTGSTLDVKGTLRLSGSTSGYVGFSVPADAGSTTYLLPAAAGTNGQVLSTNSTGTLSWVTASGGSSITQVTFAESTAAPNNIVYVDSITAAGTPSGGNVDLALSPKGTGALTAHVADSAATGGNKRGINAVDWQTKRTVATHVASGNYSVIAGGYGNISSLTYGTVGGGINNTASAQASTVAGGNANTASGAYNYIGGGQSNSNTAQYSVIAGGNNHTVSGDRGTVGGGEFNTASGQYAVVPGGAYAKAELYGKFAHASGQFAAQGDAQFGRMILRGVTTVHGSTTILTADGTGTATVTNTLVLGNNKVYYVSAQVVANAAVVGSASSTAYGTNMAVSSFNCLLKRVADAASTTMMSYSLLPSFQWISTALSTPATMYCNIAADTTLGGLQIGVTGVANTNIHWVAVITTTEVG